MVKSVSGPICILWLCLEAGTLQLANLRRIFHIMTRSFRRAAAGSGEPCMQPSAGALNSRLSAVEAVHQLRAINIIYLSTLRPTDSLPETAPANCPALRLPDPECTQLGCRAAGGQLWRCGMNSSMPRGFFVHSGAVVLRSVSLSPGLGMLPVFGGNRARPWPRSCPIRRMSTEAAPYNNDFMLPLTRRRPHLRRRGS